jgi:hypothetical protein
MFLTARRFMYQQVYFHRTVRAIDLDLAEVFGISIRAIFGDGSPAERLAAYADLDEYALLHQAARWARGDDVDPGRVSGRAGPERAGGAPNPGGTPDPVAKPDPADHRVPAAVAETWRSILLRRPSWRAEAEIRAEYEAGNQPTALIEGLGDPEPGRVAIDLAIVDARPADVPAGEPPRLAIEMRDGSSGPTLAEALGRLPGFALIGRRYRRLA